MRNPYRFIPVKSKSCPPGTAAPRNSTPLLSISPEMAHSLELVEQTSDEKKAEPPLKPVPTLDLPFGSESAAEFKILLAQSSVSCWQDKLSPQYTLGVKLQYLRQGVLLDPYITQELSCYIAPNGQAAPRAVASPLYPWMERELLQGGAQVLVLQGLAGAGKSTFNRHLLRNLWQDPAWQAYRPGDPALIAPTPIFIPLQSSQVDPRNLWDYYRHLPEIGFTSAEIRLLQRDYRMVWIADSYDEIPGQTTPNLYDLNRLSDYQGRIKLIIGCRSQRVQALSETDSLVPHGENGLPDRSLYRTRFVAPFTPQQTQDYIEKYVTHHQSDPDRPKDWDVAHYKKEFAAFPELQTLIDTPFMLWLTLSILPTLASEQARQKQQNASTYKDKKEEKEEKKEIKTSPRLTSAILYDTFMASWFARQAKKAQQQRNFLQNPEVILGKAQMQTLRRQAEQENSDAPVYWLQAAYRAFCMAVAEQLFQTGQVSIRLIKPTDQEGKQSQTKGTEVLLGDTPDMLRLRQSCPLRESSDHTWSFMHTSLFDYFITASFAEQLLLTPVVPSLPRTRYDEAETEKEMLKSPLFTSTHDKAVTLLAEKHLTPDQVRFLVDRTKENPALHLVLLRIIERSKTESAIAIASANAITTLVGCQYVFSERDFSGIRIPCADLTGSYWDRVNLTNADLSDVDLRFTWMSQCQLQGTNLKGIQLGEFPNVLAKGKISAIVMHPHNPQIMAIAVGNDILIYDHVAYQVIRTLKGHTKWINCLVYLSDGSQLASGSKDKTVCLWDPQSEQPSQVLKEHWDEVRCLVYSPDGSQLASGSGSQDKTVLLWDLRIKQLSQVLTGHTNQVNCLVYSPDGSQLASGSDDKTVRLWDLKADRLWLGGQPSKVLTGHTNQINCLVYSPDGSQLASGSDDKTVRLWDPWGEKPPQVLTGHTDQVNCLVYSPDGSQLASAGSGYGNQDHTVRLWDLQGEQPPKVLEGHTNQINCLVYSPDGSQLASGSKDKTVRLWDPRSKQPSKVLTGHTDQINCLVYSPDGSQLASGSDDKTVRLWDPWGGQLSQVLTGHTDQVNCLVYSPDASQLASGSDDKTVRLWDPWGGQLSQVLMDWIQCLVYSPDGSQLALGGMDIRLCDPRGEQQPRVLTAHTHIWLFHCLVYSPDGYQLASADGYKDGTVRLWDPQGKQPPQVLTKHRDRLNCLVYSPDGSQLASGSRDMMTVCLCDPRGEQPSQVLREHWDEVRCLVYSPDGSQLASGNRDMTVRLYNPRGEQPPKVLVGHTDQVNCLVYSPDGSQLASGSDDKTVRLWDPQGEQPSQVLAGHMNQVTCLVYSPSGSQLASGSSDNTLRLWDTLSGKCLQLWQAPAYITQLIWRVDRLFIGCNNGAVGALRQNASGQWVLAWLQCGQLPGLSFTGCDLTNVQGLTPTQTVLIEQRGGLHLPHSTIEDEKLNLREIPEDELVQGLEDSYILLTDSDESDPDEQEDKLVSKTPSIISVSTDQATTEDSKKTSLPSHHDSLVVQKPTANTRLNLLSKLSGLFNRSPHYSNQQLLTQADQLVAGISHTRTQQHYQAKLNYYRKHIDTLNKTNRKQLEQLISDLQRLHDNPTSTVSLRSHLTPADQKHQSKLSSSLKQRLWSSPKPKPTTISTSASSSSSRSSSTLFSTITPSHQTDLTSKPPPKSQQGGYGQLFSPSPVPKKKLPISLGSSTSTHQTPSEEARTLLDKVCPPQATGRGGLRRKCLQRITKYENRSLSNTLIPADHKDMEELLQTLRDIPVNSSINDSRNVFGN